MKKKPNALFSFAALLLALILEALPYGVTMRFAAGPGDSYLVHRSYFSLLPVGYGDLLPLAVGILTAGACLALGVSLLPRGKGKRAALVLNTAAAVLSGIRLALFLGYANGFMWAVTVLLLLSWVLLFRSREPRPKKTET